MEVFVRENREEKIMVVLGLVWKSAELLFFAVEYLIASVAGFVIIN